MLLGEKISRIINGGAKVADEEARQWYEWQNASVNVDYVLFEPEQYSDINPLPEEIAAYFEARKDDYKTDPMVKARYVVFDPAAYKGEISVDEEEIIDYYDSNVAEFKTEENGRSQAYSDQGGCGRR